jgi:hypothetical protein
MRGPVPHPVQEIRRIRGGGGGVPYRLSPVVRKR